VTKRGFRTTFSPATLHFWRSEVVINSVKMFILNTLYMYIYLLFKQLFSNIYFSMSYFFTNNLNVNRRILIAYIYKMLGKISMKWLRYWKVISLEIQVGITSQRSQL
jgi:hypothetical protein